jgi:aspartyl-tRNA(Asn)/glutamyl-tRNA(Gln) amidotransferase subunit A
VLLTATVPIPPFDAGREVPRGWPRRRWWTWTPLTFPFNITGQPAISVPCGFTAGGLPIGAQLVGARYREESVLQAAHAYQRACPLLSRRPVD